MNWQSDKAALNLWGAHIVPVVFHLLMVRKHKLIPLSAAKLSARQDQVSHTAATGGVSPISYILPS